MPAGVHVDHKETRGLESQTRVQNNGGPEHADAARV